MFVYKQSVSISCAVRQMSRLWQRQGYIGGKWTDAADGRTFDVYNPANGEVIGCVPDMAVAEAEFAIDAAKKALNSREWALITAKERSKLLKNWFQLIEDNSEDVARILTTESGKPITEARAEVAYGNSFVEWFAEEARRIDGELIASSYPNQELLILKDPLGVIGVITPWNFPCAMLLRKGAAALAAGCTIVIKPAEDTPFTSLALAKLSEAACIPPGVINVVTTRTAAPIGNLFCKSPKVDGISFTGSTEVGKILFRESADRIKRVSLELGGNAPFIVFPSADLEEAVNGAIKSKFRNCGQTCVSSNRFYIQEDVYDEFLCLLKQGVEALKIGFGDCEDVQIGPLINEMQIKKVISFMEDACSKNAEVITGGKPLPEHGALFYAPTVIANVDPTSRVYKEEVFGPIMAVRKFQSEAQVLQMANNSPRGLAGYFYSNDIQQIFRVARRLQLGMVGVNEGLISMAEAPFGGIKESGIGREGSHHGIDEFVEIKYICLGNLKYDH